MIVLRCRNLTYYHELDETAFFEWLGRIKGIKKIYGRGRTLYLHVSPRISATGLTALVAALRRYGHNLRQLRVFADHSHTAWFKDPQYYWYPRVFGPVRKRGRRTMQ